MFMKKYIYPDKESWEKLTKRSSVNLASLVKSLEPIYQKIKNNGDKAVQEYTRRFDDVSLDSFLLDESELEKLADGIDTKLQLAIDVAIENIRKFHSSQLVQEKVVETMPGVKCWRESRPIENVGLYIPGGSAPLFSSLLMLAIPAQLAGCKNIVVCTPPNVADSIAYCAKRLGIKNVFQIGGAQAIFAMSLGTESVPKVDKIFGPGNQYVTAAKQYIQSKGVAIDIPAGPSEVLIVADESANPCFVAADLLSQAEHGIDSQVVLVSASEDFIDKTLLEVAKQVEQLPRKEIVLKALENSVAVQFSDISQALDFSNYYAPEHLILSVKEASKLLSSVKHAGSVFLGNYSPESAGDYATGTNHTLPTSSYAKSYSGVSLDSFIKKITFQDLSKDGLRNISEAVLEMAKAEGLEAHANAVKVRLEEI
jgi:histidinol dehydrogenase